MKGDLLIGKSLPKQKYYENVSLIKTGLMDAIQNGAYKIINRDLAINFYHKLNVFSR